MNAKLASLTSFVALLGVSHVVHAQQINYNPQAMPSAPAPVETGRVISSTPVIQQVAVPTQTCGTQQVAVQPPKSGAGAVMGAIAGGAVGNAVGGGFGRGLATVAGIIGGAAVGDNIEGAPAPQIQNVQTCGTQTVYQNRTVGYNVVYEYAGKQYSTQLPQDPGQFIQLQVAPISANAIVPPPQVVYAPPAVVGAVAPYPYTYGYEAYPYLYPSVALGFGVGYLGGYYGGYRGGYGGYYHGGYGGGYGYRHWH